MTQIPDTDTCALTEVIRFRATPEVKKAVGHIAVDAGASEQNTYIHLLKLGLEAFEQKQATAALTDSSQPKPSRAAKNKETIDDIDKRKSA